MCTWHDNYIVRSSLAHMLHNFLLFYILFWQLLSSVIYAIQFFLSETKLIYFQQKGLNLIKCSLNCELWSIEAIKKLLAFFLSLSSVHLDQVLWMVKVVFMAIFFLTNWGHQSGVWKATGKSQGYLAFDKLWMNTSPLIPMELFVTKMIFYWLGRE